MDSHYSGRLSETASEDAPSWDTYRHEDHDYEAVSIPANDPCYLCYSLEGEANVPGYAWVDFEEGKRPVCKRHMSKVDPQADVRGLPMSITAQGGSGFYECSSDKLTRMIETHLPASLESLKAHINERVSGSPQGDDSYQCSANNIAEALLILADFND